METTPQNTAAESGAELWELASRACNDALRPDDLARLETMLAEDPQARRFFGFYMLMHAELAWRFRGGGETAVEAPGTWDEEQEAGDRLPLSRPLAEPLVPPIILDLSATIRHPLSTLHSPLSTNFVGGPVFSYMVATVVLGMMLLGAWAYKITHYQQSANKPTPSNTQPDMQFVGQITGMVDCRWADPNTETINGASVPLGRKYALASGLMQITYKTGVKVILEGPCTYEVESRAGGYLALGKLTAKVASGQWPVASAKPQAANLQISKSPNPKSLSTLYSPLSTLRSPLFSVRTPTAIVTDLGTEFGVEVSEDGNTTSHVFRGSVKVTATVGGAKSEVILRANESARVERGKRGGEVQLLPPGKIGAPPKFVRRIIVPLKPLDLLDIVAGGDGTGNRREHGVNPANGEIDFTFSKKRPVGEHRYSPVAWHRLIDGVFIPDGRDGAVQLDSAEHTFDGFPKTTNESYGSIWSRAADVSDANTANVGSWPHFIPQAEQYMPGRRGLLGMHANVGVTFDLRAMRNMYRDAWPGRFRAITGVADTRPYDPEADGSADVWIFVDGGLKWKRVQLRPQDGPVEVDLALGPNDRFLTLAVTDGGRPRCWPWAVFGDPVLEMTIIDEKK